jgi:Leucine-rich repeat (LRR) protein
LSSNFLKQLPIELVHLVHLETLDVSCNDLQDLPNNLQGLHSLLDLNVENNNISWFGSNVTSLHIETLNISRNSFTSIPSSFGNLLKTLKRLTLNWFK